MFFGHLVDLVQWFNQWRITFGSLPEDLIRCQWNEAICWECVSEVAMLQTDNPMQMSPVVSPITVALETDHHGWGLLQSHVSLASCLETEIKASKFALMCMISQIRLWLCHNYKLLINARIVNKPFTASENIINFFYQSKCINQFWVNARHWNHWLNKEWNDHFRGGCVKMWLCCLYVPFFFRYSSHVSNICYWIIPQRLNATKAIGMH